MGGRLAGATAIVTGGGAGIGAVIARRFAQEGAAVAVADVDGARAQEVAAALAADGLRAVAVVADVGDEASVEAMVELTEQQLGPVGVLVNNAMVCHGDELMTMSLETWEADLRVSLTGTFLCTRQVLPGMVEQGRGAIVNLSSVNGLAAFGNEAYSAAKAGIVNLTQSTAVRYGRHGVRANAIVPGSIRTPAWQQRVEREPEIFERMRKWYPLDRVGEPEDVANAALFLASEEAAWITGTTLRVDGGLLAGNDVMTREMMVERDAGDAAG